MVWHFPYYHPEKKFKDQLKEIGVNDFAVSKTFPQSAIRVGDFKLVRFYEGGNGELFNLESDIAEGTDLAKDKKAEAARLRQSLESYLKRVDARLPK